METKYNTCIDATTLIEQLKEMITISEQKQQEALQQHDYNKQMLETGFTIACQSVLQRIGFEIEMNNLTLKNKL